MKRSEIYREAAQWLLARGHGGACEALAHFAEDRDGFRGYQLANAFAELFGPTHVIEPTGIYWWFDKDGSAERILALLFMAAIVEDEERA